MPRMTKAIKRRASSVDPAPRPERRGGFVEVVASEVEDDPPLGAGTIEVVLRSGRTLRLFCRVDADVVARLVVALEAC